MRSILLMFLGVICAPLLLLAVTACEPTVYDVAHYRNDPDKNKWAKYRQRRGVEIVSKCRVDKVLSKPKDNVTYATVNC